MALTIADIQILIGANIIGFQNGMNGVQASLANVRTAFLTTGALLDKHLTQPIIAMGKNAIKAGIEFEAAMIEIGAITGATASELESFSMTAKEMSKNTVFSSKEAADGLLELLKAGVSADKVASELKGTMDLAAAGSISLADAAIIVSTSMSAFKNETLGASDVANVLSGAANASTADVHSLRLGMSQASAVAASVGLTFEDTAAALALFANNGLRGSDAGTSFKTMLLNLQPHTKKQKDLFQKLGLVTDEGTSKFYDASGQVKDLAGISETLNTALAGMTDAQRLSTLQTLFGTDAIRAANIIFGEGKKGVEELKLAMGDVSAEEIAKEKTKSLSAQLQMLKNDVDRAGISVTEMGSGPLVFLVGKLRDLVNWFEQTDDSTKAIIIGFGLVIAAIGPVILIVGQVGLALDALAIIGAALGITSLPALGAAFLALVPYIAAAILAGYLIIQNWDDISAAAKHNSESATKKWQELQKNLEGIFGQTDKDMKTFTVTSKTTWGDWLTFEKDRTANDMKYIQGYITDALAGADKVIGEKTEKFKKDFGDWATKTDADVKAGMEAVGKWIQDNLVSSEKAITEKTTSWGTTFGNWITETDKKFATKMPEIGKSITDFLTISDEEMDNWAESTGETVGKVVKFFIDLPEKIDKELQKLRQRISDKWADVRTNTVAWWDIIVGQVQTYVESLPGRIQTGLQNIRQTISDKWADVRTNTVAWWNIIVGQVTTYVESIPERITAGLQNTRQRISDKWADVRTNTVAWWGIIVGQIQTYVESIPGRIENALYRIKQQLYDKWREMYIQADEWFAATVAQIVAYVTSLPGTLYNKALRIGQKFWEGFQKGVSGSPKTKIEYAFIDMGNQALATLNYLGSLAPKYGSVGNKLSNAFGTPAIGMMGEPSMGIMGSPSYAGSGMGSTGLSVPISPMGTSPMTTPEANTEEGSWGGVNVSVGQLVVREEADILKIAQELYRLQKDKTRGRGQR